MVHTRYLQTMTQISWKTNSTEAVIVTITVMRSSILIGQGVKSSNVIGSTDVVNFVW